MKSSPSLDSAPAAKVRPSTALPSSCWERPLPAGSPFCVLIPDFLTREICAKLIEWSEGAGFSSAGTDYPPSYRDNDRLVRDETALAAELTERLRRLAPAELPGEASGESWIFQAINERLRLCRYRAGQSFQVHQDGVHHRGPELRSRLTFMIYLTDGSDFGGGDTLFFSAGPGGDAEGRPARLIGRVRPRAGTLILFDHSLWHSGDTVTRGVKHILRSDVLYRRQASGVAPDEGPATSSTFAGHSGYVWCLQRLSNGLLASGGRDTIIRLWNAAGDPAGALRGHEQSVLGLAELPHGRLASVSRDRTLRLWDSKDGLLREVRAHESAVLSVTALPNGHLATGGADGTIRIWSVPELEPVRTLSGPDGWVWQLAALGGNRLASAAEGGSVRIWPLASGQCQRVLRGPLPLRALAALEEGRVMLAGNIAGEIVVWRQGEGGSEWAVSQRLAAHGAAVRALRLIRPGIVASGGEDHLARLWRWTSDGLQPLAQAPVRHANFVTDFAPATSGYVSCSYDGTIAPRELPGDR